MRPHLLAAAASLLLAACATPVGPAATATLSPTTGNSTTGSVRFVQRGNLVEVSGEVRGLRPNTEHGFHIHETGDCSSGDGLSAGGHYNPMNQPHGRYDMPAHHAGDLQSLHADASGVARFRYDLPGITVGGAAADVIGKGVIVHRDADDFTSQPAGNSGPRLACGVIMRG